MDSEKNLLLESIKTGLINEDIESDIFFQPKIITNDYKKKEKVLASIDFLLQDVTSSFLMLLLLPRVEF